MSPRKAAVVVHTDPVMDCPILDGTARSEFTAAAKAANAFGAAVLKFLEGRSAEERVAWMRASAQAGRELFQPWSLELLFVLSTLGRARFNQLQELLGLSSRTLSDKLKGLREGGFVEREIFDEQPVRIEYFLTKHGRRTAALTAPLFGHLNHEAMRAAGRI